MPKVSESEWSDVPEVRSSDENAWLSSEDSGLEEDALPLPTPTVDNELDYFESFDPRWRDAFEGLLYLGHLEGTVKIDYHDFVVRTLTSGEKIEVIRITQELEGSLGYPRAYRAAVVAAGILLADARPIPVASRQVSAIRQKYRWVTDNWHDVVIDLLYAKINQLEGQVVRILEELGVAGEIRKITQVTVEENGQTEGS